MEGQHFAHDLQNYVLLFPAGQGLTPYFNFVKSHIILSEPDLILNVTIGLNVAISIFYSYQKNSNFYFDNFCPPDVLPNN